MIGTCGISVTGAAAGSPECVQTHYDQKRAEWIARLTGPALEEANRSLEQHLAVQADLQRLGFLSASAKPVGVYADSTRTAIVEWQGDADRPVTGFLSDGDVLALGEGPPSPPAVAAAPSPPAPDTILPKEGYGGYVQNTRSGDTGSLPSSGGPATDAPVASTTSTTTAAADSVSDAVIFLVLIALGAYFLPTIVAIARHHHNAAAIFLLNLLLGWSFLGWVGALIWSATAIRRSVT